MTDRRNNQFGIDTSRESEGVELESLRFTPNKGGPLNDAENNEKLDKLISLLEEMHIRNRENNAILYQMIFTLEEKLNRRVDTVRKELLDEIFASNGRTSFSGADNHSNGTIKHKTLAKLFDSIDPSGQQTQILHSDHISNDPYKDMTTITVFPTPGFVVKTRRLLGEKEKAFINVLHHPQVRLEPPSVASVGISTEKPFIICGVVLSSVDKQGTSCLVYNIAVSSEYFAQPKGSNNTTSTSSQSSVTQEEKEPLKITSPQAILKIIQKVNARFDEFLDENSYSLPRMAAGFKGDSVHPITIPVDKKAINSLTGMTKGANVSTPQLIPFESHNEPAKAKRQDSIDTKTVEEAPRARTISDTSDISTVTSTLPAAHPDANRKSISETYSTGSVVGAPKHRRMSSVSSADGGSGTKSVKPHRKSIFETANFGYNGGTILGRNLLSSDMLEYVKSETVESKDAAAIKEESIANPSVLLGWQIKLVDGSESALFVVTDVRKNYLQKTEFRLSKFNQDDIWVLLRRKENKQGYEFRPMRKVLFGLNDDEEDEKYDLASEA